MRGLRCDIEGLTLLRRNSHFHAWIYSSCIVFGNRYEVVLPPPPPPQCQLGQELEEEVEAMLTAMRRELIRAAEEAGRK